MCNIATDTGINHVTHTAHEEKRIKINGCDGGAVLFPCCFQAAKMGNGLDGWWKSPASIHVTRCWVGTASSSCWWWEGSRWPSSAWASSSVSAPTSHSVPSVFVEQKIVCMSQNHLPLWSCNSRSTAVGLSLPWLPHSLWFCTCAVDVFVLEVLWDEFKETPLSRLALVPIRSHRWGNTR